MDKIYQKDVLPPPLWGWNRKNGDPVIDPGIIKYWGPKKLGTPGPKLGLQVDFNRNIGIPHEFSDPLIVHALCIIEVFQIIAVLDVAGVRLS